MSLDGFMLKRFSWDNQYGDSLSRSNGLHSLMSKRFYGSSDFKGAPLQIHTTDTQGHSMIYLALLAVDNLKKKGDYIVVTNCKSLKYHNQ